MIFKRKHPVLNTPKPREHKRPWAEFGRELGIDGCPYLKRWVLDLRLFSIRLHHFMGNDDERAHHDHAWDFLTVILKGGYTDRSPSGDTHMRRGHIYFRKAEHQHTVVIDDGGVWTLCVTGWRRRNWGYWVNGKFRKVNKYYKMFGHHKPSHPCD